jgi:hypothetical protein
MNVDELIKELKSYKIKYGGDTPVAWVTDFDNPDEEGNLPTNEVTDVTSQRYPIDNGFDMSDDEIEIVLL